MRCGFFYQADRKFACWGNHQVLYRKAHRLNTGRQQDWVFQKQSTGLGGDKIVHMDTRRTSMEKRDK
eukprot:12487072-Heterocapsa_arctica.AAC.1